MACLMIFAYCLGVVLFSFSSKSTLANQSAPPQAVKSASTFRFASSADAPDPNQVLDLINKERLTQGQAGLVANEKLGSVASARATDMAKRQYYAHKAPDGKYYYDYMAASNINVDYSCENLDMIFVPDTTIIINDWLASNKGHSECMLSNQVTQAGYAVIKTVDVDFNGKQSPAYIVVAIHTTDIN